jgi:general secretion pathway protein D
MTWNKTLATLAVMALLVGCAAQRHHSEGIDLIANGKTAEGLEQLRQANELEPGNARYRVDYLTQRQLAVQRQLQRADELYVQGQFDEAAERLVEILKIDPNNERARRALNQIELRRKAEARLQEADRLAADGQHAAALEIVRKVAKDLPGHPGARAVLQALEERVEADRLAREDRLGARAVLRKPVTLQFREASVRQVFEAISRSTGLNIVLDRDIRADLRTTIFVKDASVEDAIDLILLQNQLEKRSLNANSLMIYPATAAKQKDYAELRVRTFQLSNADAGQISNLLKSMLKVKEVLTDAKTNTLIIRDTAEVIAVAEQLVAANDVPDPEVMLEVEVLEVSATRAEQLGLQWPTGVSLSTQGTSAAAATTGAAATTSGSLTLGDLRRTWSTFANGRDSLLVSPLGLGINFNLTDSDANILASPRIRARNKEKARIMVGDRVPVITNLISPGSGGSGSNGNVLTGSIQYVEVGLKLDVEPQVYADNDVGIKINLEVSNIVSQISSNSGVAYQIGTRSAQTSLRLRDGETQVLAGLINDEDRNTASKVPGLGQLPILGHLFRNDSDSRKKSEIVLSITPHIIRPLAYAGQKGPDIFTGSESAVRSKPLRVEAMEVLKLGDGKPAPGSMTLPVPAQATAPTPVAPAPIAPAVAPVQPATTPATAPAIQPDAAVQTAAPLPEAAASRPAVVQPPTPKLSVGQSAPVIPLDSEGIQPIPSGLKGIPAAMPYRLPGRTPLPAVPSGGTLPPSAYGAAGAGRVARPVAVDPQPAPAPGSAASEPGQPQVDPPAEPPAEPRP